MSSRNTPEFREEHARLVAQRAAEAALAERIARADGNLAIHQERETAAQRAARMSGFTETFEATFGRAMKDRDPLMWDSDFTDEPRPTPEREIADTQAISLGNAALRSGDASLAVQSLTIRTCKGLILTDENLHHYPVEEVAEWLDVRDAIWERCNSDVQILLSVTRYVYVADLLKSAIHRYAKLPTVDRVRILRENYRQVVSDFGTDGTPYAINVIYSWLFMYLQQNRDARQKIGEALDLLPDLYPDAKMERIRVVWGSLHANGVFEADSPKNGFDVVDGMLLLAALITVLNPEQDNSLENTLNVGNFIDTALTLAHAELNGIVI